MSEDTILREHIRDLLEGKGAHMNFDEAVANFPLEHINTRPPNVSYTPWHLLEHIRIAQRDILDFMRGTDYVELAWPAEYWPAEDEQADRARWEKTLHGFRADLQELLQMAADPKLDLYQKIPHGSGQTMLREFLVVADHNAYHIGEFAILRQVMGTWTSERS
ncbi:DinB family protein [Ktedonosporobacter rubrisoli]|nr:DinB family protein [Ktedonosporobacter rubrisoli]